MLVSPETSSHLIPSASSVFTAESTTTFTYYNTHFLFRKHQLSTIFIKMRSATLLALLPFALAAPSSSVSRRAEPAPVIRPRGVKLVDGKYIVKMKSGVQAASVDNTVSTLQANADYTYTKSFRGFAGSLKDDEIEKLKHDPNVSRTDHDRQGSSY